jgi:hypothetical protein
MAEENGVLNRPPAFQVDDGLPSAGLFGGCVFACRQCHRLACSSQREADDARGTRRADEIRRLGWIAGILKGDGWKPQGMRWRTFERLQASHDFHVNAALAGVAARLGLLGERPGDFGLGE